MRPKSKRQFKALVWACAWCSPDTYRPLKKGEAYTHGICLVHKVQFLAKAYRKFGLKA
jgi:hypothetical protein